LIFSLPPALPLDSFHLRCAIFFSFSAAFLRWLSPIFADFFAALLR